MPRQLTSDLGSDQRGGLVLVHPLQSSLAAKHVCLCVLAGRRARELQGEVKIGDEELNEEGSGKQVQ